MRRQALTHPAADLFSEFRGRRATFLQHHIGLDDLGAHRIRFAHGGRQRHVGMARDAVLDFGRPDPVAGGRDDVVVAAEEMDIAVLVGDALVAGQHPVADELLRRRFRVLPVFEEHHRIRPAHRDLACLSRLQHPAAIVDDRDVVPRNRLADRPAAAHPDRCAGRQDEIAFRLAVEFVDRDAEFLARPVIGLAPERLAAGADRPDRQVEAAANVVRAFQHAQRGRRDEGVAYRHPLHQRQGGFRLEPLEASRNHRHAEIEPRQQHVQQAAGPRPVGRRPQPVARLRQELVRHLDAGQVSQKHPVAVQRALGRTCRPRGEDHHRRVVGTGVLGCEVRPMVAGQPSETGRRTVVAIGRHDRLEHGQARQDRLQLGEPRGIGHHRLHAGCLETIFQRLDAKQQRQRHRDRAELVGRDMGNRRLEALRHQHRYPVAAADSRCAQPVSERVRSPRERAICQVARRPVGLIIEKRDAVGLARRPGIRHGDADVEARRDLPAEIVVKRPVCIAWLKHVCRATASFLNLAGPARPCHAWPRRRSVVPLAGIEPALLAERDFESRASTNSATGAVTLEADRKRTIRAAPMPSTAICRRRGPAIARPRISF